MQKKYIKWCKETHASFYVTIDSLGEWKKNHMKISKSWNFEIKGYKEMIPLLNYLVSFLFIRFKKFNSRCRSHVQ
jgi:hypothetical protein